jgi:hypothetical protein
MVSCHLLRIKVRTLPEGYLTNAARPSRKLDFERTNRTSSHPVPQLTECTQQVNLLTSQLVI